MNWINTKVRPPERGLIVKRWRTLGGSWSYWAGMYYGDTKAGSCDEWMPLPQN